MSMTAAALRVLIVEDEWVVARDLQRQLEGDGHQPVGPVASGLDALQIARRERPDLALVDVGLEGQMDGTELARVLWAELAVPSIYVTGRWDMPTLERAAHPGTLGYVVKPFDPSQLKASVSLAATRLRVAAAGSDADWDPMRATLTRLRTLLDTLEVRLATPGERSVRAVPGLERLSPREHQVLSGLLRNQRVPAIAERLSISQNTVRNHLKSVYRKLGVSSQVELIAAMTPADEAR